MVTPDLHVLDAFAAVARHRSFRKAAAERGVSASALSHALRGLEERLGVRLLNRSTRSVAPTDAGLRLLSRLSPAMRDIADALAEVRGLQDVPAGVLRLNVPRQAARLLLAPLLARFAANYPRIQVEMITDDGLADVVGAGFDAGIRFGESLSMDMIAVPIGRPQRFTVVASPGFLAKNGVPLEPRDLTMFACICRRFPSGKHYAWEFSRNGKEMSIAVNGPLILDDDEVMVRAALDGAGLAYVYEEHVRDAVAAVRLVSVLESWSQTPARLFLYYPSRRQLPSALKAFIDVVRAARSSSDTSS